MIPKENLFFVYSIVDRQGPYGRIDGWLDEWGGEVLWGHMSPVNISPVTCHRSVKCRAALQYSAGQWHRQTHGTTESLIQD